MDKDTLKKIEYLKMIQGVIERMGRNSFALKGWAVTLVAGIFALSDKDAEKPYFFIAYIPIIIFWCLDAYYLLKERLLRRLYDAVRAQKEEEMDFNMDTSKFNQKGTYIRTVTSKSEMGFYMPLALVTACIAVICLFWK